MTSTPPDKSETRAHFEETGFLQPLPLLNEAALSYLRDLDVAENRVANANRAKALWQIDQRVLEIARHERVTDVLDELYGGHGYHLWGAQVIDRQAGQTHQWHCDIETAGEGFVSLWIGVDGLSRDTSLRGIVGSHRMTEPLQAEFSWDDPARSDPSGAQLVARVRDRLADGQVESIDCAPGEGIFFDGRLWHGTFNPGERRRRSLLLQYGRRGIPVRHYRDWKKYPFEYDAVRVPTVLSLRGEPEPVTNKTLAADADGNPGAPVARTCAAPRLAAPEGNSWTRLPYFETVTPVMEHLRCHASILRGGVMPHLPHEHDDEELLIVLSGSAGIVTQGDAPGQWQVRAAEPGDVFYYPSGYSHTILNRALEPASEPLTYLMFRWRARASEIADAEPFHIPSRVVRGKKRLTIDRPASRLAKLHVHTTELEPGQKFPRHIDLYDSTFVVLRGELTVIDQTLGPGGVFLTRAGELHDTGNRGTEPCKYLVFEFHHESSFVQPVA